MIEIDGKVNVLHLSDNDRLIYTTPAHLHAKQRAHITDMLSKQFPKNNVIIIDGDAALTVVTEGVIS